MFVNQFPFKDLARKMDVKYKVHIIDSLAKALTVGADRIAVDGVTSISEHGDYLWKKLGQHFCSR